MTDFQRTVTIQAPPERVFQFVSDPTNLPRYLPTIREAHPESGDRVRVRGESAGHRFDASTYFRVEEPGRRLEWGVEAQATYTGWLEVVPAPEAGSSRLTVHLSFQPGAEFSRGPAQRQHDRDLGIEQDLEQALRLIQRAAEGVTTASRPEHR